MKKILVKSIPNHEAMKSAAKDIWENHLQPEAKFSCFLEGSLGAGKTYFIREVLHLAGITQEIPSPTYTLVNEYNTDTKNFAHFDFYRLEAPQDFFARGFTDITDTPNTCCFAEWTEKISPDAKAAFTGKKYVIKIDFGIGVGMRKLTLLEA